MKRRIAALTLLAIAIIGSQSRAGNVPSMDGLSPNGRSFTPPTSPTDPFNPPRVNPYTKEPLPVLNKKSVLFDQAVEIPVPARSLVLLKLKTPKGAPVEPDQIYLSNPEVFRTTVVAKSSSKTIMLRSAIDDTTPLPGSDVTVGPSAGSLREGFAFIETPKGTVALKLVLLPSNQPQNWELTLSNWGNEAGTATTDDAGNDRYELFDYHLNNTPKNPIHSNMDTPTEREVAGSPVATTDRVSRSPEARSYNPYGPEGNVALSYYTPEPLNAPEITTELLPTAINMMRRYDEQRARGVVTDDMVQRKRVGKRYLMGGDQEIYLGDAYRFPKYASTAVRIVWNNNTAKPQYLNPEKVGLKIGRFIHIPTVYGQTRNVVFPGQNNELYLVYRIPNADIDQDYELILPKRTATVRTAAPQPLPAQ